MPLSPRAAALRRRALPLYPLFAPDPPAPLASSRAQVSATLFDEAVQEIFLLMQRDTFPRFKQSTHFDTFKTTLPRGPHLQACRVTITPTVAAARLHAP